MDSLKREEKKGKEKEENARVSVSFFFFFRSERKETRDSFAKVQVDISRPIFRSATISFP